VALALLVAFLAVQRGYIASYDGKIMAHLAHRLLFDHTLTIDPRADLMGLHHPYTSYGIGTTLLLLPFAWLQHLLAPTKHTWLTLANPLALALCGALVTRIGLELRWHPFVALATGIGFGLLTPALWQSTEVFPEPGVTLGLLVSLLGLLCFGRGEAAGAWFVGVGVATSILCRLDSVLLLAPFLAAAGLDEVRKTTRSVRAAAGVLVPIAAALVFQMWYNAHRYGSVFDAGFASQSRDRGFTGDLVDGLALLVWSPGKGFFWYSPVLLLALPGFMLLYRKRRVLALALGAVCLIRFLFFAKWWTPAGGVTWGPRLVFPVTAVMAVAAGEFVDQARQWASPMWRRFAIGGIAALALTSAGISALSVSQPYEKFWHSNVDAAPVAVRLQRRRDYFWSVTEGPMAGNLRFLRAGAKAPLMHFADGPSLVGVLAVAGCLGALGAGLRDSLRS
jgi:hypothetical protein